MNILQNRKKKKYLEDSKNIAEYPDENFRQLAFSIVWEKTWLLETGGGGSCGV